MRAPPTKARPILARRPARAESALSWSTALFLANLLPGGPIKPPRVSDARGSPFQACQDFPMKPPRRRLPADTLPSTREARTGEPCQLPRCIAVALRVQSTNSVDWSTHPSRQPLGAAASNAPLPLFLLGHHMIEGWLRLAHASGIKLGDGHGGGQPVVLIYESRKCK